VQVAPVILFDQRVAYYYLNQIASQINQPVAEGTLVLNGTDVIAQPGKVGRELMMDATLLYLSGQLQTFADGEIPLVVQEIQPQILDVSGQADKARQILSQSLSLVIPDASANDPAPYVYTPEVLASLISIQRTENGVQVGLGHSGLRDILVPIKSQVDRKASDAKFIFNDDTRQLDVMAESQVGRTKPASRRSMMLCPVANIRCH
jgi:vancomycin resistance protein YoaR